MFSRLIFICCIPIVFCSTDDHIEDFLQNKTLEDIIELRKHYHRAMYLKQKEHMADSSQENLLLADGAVLPCEANWHQYPDTGCCYRVSDAKSDWYGGTAICQSLNADAQMASFHSQAESIYVANKYSQIHAWTGLSQTQVPNTWTYTDGTPDWHWFPALSSPPSDASHSCVEMMDGILGLLFALSLQKGQTNPYSCSEVNQIICKYCPRETTSTPTTTTTVTTTTPTTTTTTTTPTTTTSTTTKTTTTTKPTITTTITTTKPTTTTKTTTNSAATTTKTATTSKKTGTCNSPCPTSTASFNNKCYKMCTGSVNFEDSCKWCGGTMLTVVNEAENDFISRVFGANDETTSQIWIGNTETSDYLNWAEGQPYKPNDGLDYCISMDLSAGPTRGKHSYIPCQNTVVNSICLMNF